MKALNKKLWRDLWKTKGQAMAIVMVVASGIATFVMLRSAMHTLELTQKKFYIESGFSDIFASLKRTPESLKERIAAIPGVDIVETRVVANVKLRLENFDEPVTARIVSVPEDAKVLLNRAYIKHGRMPDPLKDEEAVVSEAFAQAHGFAPGARIEAVINGRWKRLTIVGTALCPEFIMPVRPGGIFPDFKRYAILWMGRPALAKAFNMEGAFNDVAMTLTADANPEDVITRIDNILSSHGGLGAYARKDQTSHRFLSEEFKQLEVTSRLFPIIFISVATFLLYVVISRTVSIQREQIATLKAFGYSSADIAAHYIKTVFLITFAGVALGICVGIWFGKRLSAVYMEFYRFPYLIYELKRSTAVSAVLITLACVLTGTMYSLWKASSQPPAQAMRPEPPARYYKSVIERLGLWRFFSQASRIIIRNLERRPIRSLLSIIGISLSCGAMVSATFFADSIDYLVDIQFKRSQKQDLTVSFIEPTSRRAIHELQGMEGIEHVEPFRAIAVRLRNEHKTYRTTIQGIENNSALQLLLDTRLKAITLPPDGVLLTKYLAGLLDVEPGHMITVEVLEGSRPVRQAPVVGLFEQFIGVAAYMEMTSLNRMLKEGQIISGVYLTADSLLQKEIYTSLIDMPRVAGTLVRKDDIRNFYEIQAEMFLFFTLIATILASIIVFGVVYNNARISLSERSRELASLRVLGYTKTEISFIFLGELGFLTLFALPLGFLIGKAMSIFLAEAVGSDLFRIPVLIEPDTYALAAATVIVSACLSGFIVRRRLDKLDLVSALKTKE